MKDYSYWHNSQIDFCSCQTSTELFSTFLDLNSDERLNNTRRIWFWTNSLIRLMSSAAPGSLSTLKHVFSFHHANRFPKWTLVDVLCTKEMFIFYRSYESTRKNRPMDSTIWVRLFPIVGSESNISAIGLLRSEGMTELNTQVQISKAFRSLPFPFKLFQIDSICTSQSNIWTLITPLDHFLRSKYYMKSIT